jgi:hypothetical protein
MALRANWKKFGWLAQANNSMGSYYFQKSDIIKVMRARALSFAKNAGGRSGERGTHTIFEHENNYEIFCS